MDILLLYTSGTGFTKRYADWIGEELGIEAVPFKDCTPARMAQADLVIYGGSVNGGILTGQAKAERMAKRAGNRPVIWFATGLRPATERTLGLLRKNNFGSGSEVPLFYFPGGLDKEKLRPGDRTMLRVYRAMLRRRRGLHPEDAEIIRRLITPADYSDRNAIAPLVEYVRSLRDRAA